MKLLIQYKSQESSTPNIDVQQHSLFLNSIASPKSYLLSALTLTVLGTCVENLSL